MTIELRSIYIEIHGLADNAAEGIDVAQRKYTEFRLRDINQISDKELADMLRSCWRELIADYPKQ